jgi:hypothetical protein
VGDAGNLPNDRGSVNESPESGFPSAAGAGYRAE